MRRPSLRHDRRCVDSARCRPPADRTAPAPDCAPSPGSQRPRSSSWRRVRPQAHCCRRRRSRRRKRRTPAAQTVRIGGEDYPNPLRLNDGDSVTTAAEWENTRRAELLADFRQNVYGQGLPDPTRANLPGHLSRLSRRHAQDRQGHHHRSTGDRWLQRDALRSEDRRQAQGNVPDDRPSRRGGRRSRVGRRATRRFRRSSRQAMRSRPSRSATSLPTTATPTAAR